jgi:hypothetical protein
MASIRFKLLATAPIEIIESTGARGDSYEASLAKPSPAEDYVGVSLYVHGQIKVTRTAGVPNAGGKPYVWNPRGFSADRALPAVVSPGTFRFEVLSEAAVYYCVRRADRALMNYEVVRLVDGVIPILKGQRFFLADGAVDVAGATLLAPRLIYAASGDLSLAAKNAFGLILRA